MDSPVDWCKYFQDIERDPRAITPRITVRQWLEARNHIQNCDPCSNRVDRVLASAPPESPFPKPKEN